MPKDFISDQEMMQIEGAQRPSVKDLRDKLKSKDVLSDDEMNALLAEDGQDQEPSDADLGFYVRSALEGQTAGISEPIISGGKAAYKSYMAGTPFKQEYAADIEQRKREKGEHPYQDVAAQVAGGLIPTPINVGAKLAAGAKGLIGAGKTALGIGGTVGKGLLSRVAGAGAEAALESGITSAGYETVKQLAQKPTGFEEGNSLEKIKQAGLLGAGFGGVVGAGIQSSKEAARLVGEGGKKLLKTYFGGVPVQLIDKYLENPQALRTAKNAEEVKMMIDESIDKIMSDLNSKNLAVKDAKDVLKTTRDQMYQTFKEQNMDAREAVRMANQSLKEAQQKAVLGAAQDLQQDILSLRKQVTEGSSGAFDILDKADIKMKSASLVKSLKKEIKSHSIAGEIPPELAKSTAGLQEFVSRLPEEVSGPEIKKLLQYVQRSTDYARSGTEFTGNADEVFQNFARGIRNNLNKKSPQYAKEMEKVAANTRLLRDLSPFGDMNAAVSKLSTIGTAKNVAERDALKRLGEITGRNYIDAIEQTRLSEFKDVKTAEQMTDYLRRKGLLNLEEKIGQTKEAEKAQMAEQALREAEEKYEPIKGLLPGPTGSKIQGKMRQIGGPRENIETRKQFEALSRLSDKDFMTEIENMRFKEAFMQPRAQGSASTNVWGMMGGSAGLLLGGPMGAAAGGGTGTAIGKYMDHFGPEITKKVLDAVLFMKNNPSVQRIQALNLPDKVKAELIKDFAVYQSAAKGE